ncbi:MAG: hypothetical protein AAFU85_07860 [Planctomycetota bacterium]
MAELRSKRRGMSLLEVTIGAMMVATVTVVAAGVAVDMTRSMAGNISETRVAAEARLAIESFRRDFAGNDPDSRIGERDQWRLVGRMIPANDELRLCFDSGTNRTADWTAPDRVIIYSLDEGQLLRTDVENTRGNIIAHHVSELNFEVVGAEIRITLTFELLDVTETYVFNTPDV